MASIETDENGREVEAYSLNKWQRFHFQLNPSDAQPVPSDRADAVRGILAQLHVSSVCNKLPDDLSAQLKLQYTSLYSSIIDCSDTETGLNNYAEGALALSTNHPNESSRWTSSLTKHVMKRPWMKEFIEDSERAGQDRKEQIRKDAENLLHARKQLPAVAHPANQLKTSTATSSNCQQKSGHWSNSVEHATNGSGARPPTNVLPQSSAAKPSSPPLPAFSPNAFPPRPNDRDQISPVNNPGVGKMEPVRNPNSRFPHQARGIYAGTAPRVPDGLSGNAPSRNVPTSDYGPARGGHPRAFNNPLGTGRGVINNPGSGSVGYDPASQMCSLGLFGLGDSSSAGSHGGQPSLKRKLGATDNGKPGTANWNPSHQMPSQPGGGSGFGSRASPRTGQSLFNRGPRPSPRLQEEDDIGTGENGPNPCGPFRSARDQLNINNQKKFGNRGGGVTSGPSSSGYGTNRKVLGVTRRGPSSKFVPPTLNKEDGNMGGYKAPVRSGGSCSNSSDASNMGGDGQQEPTDERLKNVDPKMVELIMSEIMDHGPPIQWDDIAGLEFAKSTIKEIVVWPMLRPDIFTGLRGPPKGLLLFGPPGTGKTLIGKCIACQSGATFFSISASSLTSKWVGEGEKMVRALFAVARCYQPAVIFIDEIDSLLSQRSNDEHESSRRIKTEFLVQLDGATTSSDERLLIVGATNRPQEIDEAARRRLVKRLYIPLPESGARRQIVCSLLSQQSHSLSDQELDDICSNTKGYSGADMANLCREAALGPIRAIQGMDIQHISADQVRAILHRDFTDALQNVRPSVAQSDLDIYLDWNSKFGCGSAK